MLKPRTLRWIGGATGTTFLLMLAATAFGAGRYSKKEDAVIATQTTLTRPVIKPEREKTKPGLTASDVFAGQGAELIAITDSQIKILQRLIDVTGESDPEKPDLLFRMAELYAEQERYYSFKARDLDEKIFEAQNKGNTPLANQLKAQQKDFERREKEWLLGAVKKYIEVANGPRFQTYQKMDQVLFYLAYLLTQVKKEEQARVFFRRLIRDYPQSPYLPHAYLSFGEYFFENRDLENALKFYEMVLQYQNSPVYGFALYKKGWVYFNLTDFRRSLATFVEVVQLAQSPRRSVNGKPAKNDAQLAREAKKDIVRAYAQIGSPEKAYPFFQKHGGDYAMTMLESLAELYNAQGKFADSIKAYRELIKLDPGTTKLCNWQTEILKNTLSMTGSRAVPETVKELQRLSAVYEKTVGMQGLKKEVIDECRDNTAGMLRELATVWHREAQKTNDMPTYAHASDLYKEYMRRFPKEKDSYLMRWWYGELLFKLGSLDQSLASHWYCDAAPAYTDVVKADQKGPKLKEAAYAAVISWKNCLDVTDAGEDERQRVAQDRATNRRQATAGKDPMKEDNSFAARPIPEKQQKMLEAFDTYIKYVPESPELVTIKYLRARIFYESNRFAEAMPLFKDIVENHRRSELAIYSAHLLLDCMAITKDFKSLAGQVDKLLATPEFQRDAAFIGEIEKIKLAALRREIEETERTGDYRRCGILYLQLADRYPDAARIDEVYYNAGVCFERARLMGLAIAAREKLIQLKPGSQLARRAVYRVGQNFQQIAAYESAAEKYERFATDFPGEIADPMERDPVKRIDAPLALNTAAFFRRGLGQIDQSIRDVETFVRSYGGRPQFFDQAASVFFEMGQIYEQRKDHGKLKQHLNEYLRSWAQKGGIDRQIIAEVKLGEIAWRDACPVPGVNGACIEIKRERASSATALAQGRGKMKLGQCGPETKSKITLHGRRPALVREAMAHFQKALQLFAKGAAAAKVPQDDPAVRDARVHAMTYFAAQARMTEGDLAYEKLLAMTVPTGLVFDPTQRTKDAESKKRLATWLQGKTKQLKDAQGIYQEVILFKNAHWVIAAAARIGQLFQDFANGLYTAEVPQPPPPPPGVARDEYGRMFRDAYCDAMTDTAGPLDDKAVEGLSICLNKSTDLNWFNEWSKLCELELNQIKPREYPLASEIRAEPGYAGMSYDVAPLLMSAATRP